MTFCVVKLTSTVCLVVMCVFMKVEEKCSVLSREKNELQSRTEENDEEVDELMRKFKAAVQQVRSFTYSLSLST